MSAENAGPARAYQVTWRSGHIETVVGHQVTLPLESVFPSMSGEPRSTKVKIHGYIDGHWTLVLAADESDILTIRLLTSEEVPES